MKQIHTFSRNELVQYLHLCCQFLEVCLKMKMYKNDCRVFYSSLRSGKKKQHVLLLEVETFGFFFFTWSAPVIFAEMEV